MRVKFLAYLRDYTNCAEVDMPAVPTVGDLVCALGERYDSRLRDKLLAADGGLSAEIIIMVNGRHVVHSGGFDAPLNNDDTVLLFPMVAGG